MEQITVNPKRYFYLEGKTTLKNLMEYAAPNVDLAYAESERLGLEKTGPIEFIYFGATSDQDKKFTLQIGFPVKAEKEASNGFQYLQSTHFKCISHRYKGPLTSIGAEYEKIFEHLWNNSIKHSDEIREIYHFFEYPDSPNNITEIQIGLI